MGVSIEFLIIAMLLVAVCVRELPKGKKEQRKEKAELENATVLFNESSEKTRQLTDAVNDWNKEAGSLCMWMYETVQALNRCNDALKRTEAREAVRNEEIAQLVKELQKYASVEISGELGVSEIAAIREHKGVVHYE